MTEPDASPSPARLVSQARVLQTVSAISQIGLMFALFVMWKHYGVPFGKAFGRCFVAGVTVYVVLGTAASVLMTLARMQPVHFLLRQILAIVSVAIFAALHWVYGLGIIQSAIGWAAIYFGARLLVARIEKRAMQKFRIG